MTVMASSKDRMRNVLRGAGMKAYLSASGAIPGCLDDESIIDAAKKCFSAL